MKKINLKSRALCQLFKETCDVQKKANDVSQAQDAVFDLCFIIRDLIEEIDKIGAKKSKQEQILIQKPDFKIKI